MTKSFSRLPTTVVPGHYVIKLKPDLAKFTFSGEVVVEAKVLEPVTEVLCNSSNLEFQACSIKTGDVVVSPEVVLVGLLPPLLYAAAIQTSLVDFNAKCVNDFDVEHGERPFLRE